jgi:universal stress protein E
MNRINHILVVVDRTASSSQSAVDKAGLLAQCLDATVELLICDVESALDDDILSLRAHKTPASNTQLLDLLNILATPMRTRNTEVTVRLIYGKSLHDSLLDYLKASNADLVVKDTHHHSLAKRTLLRNTDWQLARGCPVPLLLTKRKSWGQPPVIMAAVDPNQANERAAALDRDILSGAASLAGRLSGVSALHAYLISRPTLSSAIAPSASAKRRHAIRGLLAAYSAKPELFGHWLAQPFAVVRPNLRTPRIL